MYKITVFRKSNKIKVESVKKNVQIKTVKRKINIQSSGKRGLPGPQGPAGQDGHDGAGLPIGGLPGQTIIKSGNDDYDIEWGSISGADKNYVQSFNISSDVLVSHNLLKFPAVTVHDSAGDEVEGIVNHIDVNTLELHFSAPFSGVVTCN